MFLASVSKNMSLTRRRVPHHPKTPAGTAKTTDWLGWWSRSPGMPRDTFFRPLSESCPALLESKPMSVIVVDSHDPRFTKLHATTLHRGRFSLFSSFPKLRLRLFGHTSWAAIKQHFASAQTLMFCTKPGSGDNLDLIIRSSLPLMAWGVITENNQLFMCSASDEGTRLLLDRVSDIIESTQIPFLELVGINADEAQRWPLELVNGRYECVHPEQRMEMSMDRLLLKSDVLLNVTRALMDEDTFGDAPADGPSQAFFKRLQADSF